ncbi:MAG: hypothetical protein GY801_18795 [bacterium]|nr:hypothetical protein [bacterium]
MNTTKQIINLVTLLVMLGSFTQICTAQDEGVIKTISAENGDLPPGAVYENGVVSHPIGSAEENLHLLAGYYYRNPREWKRIYKDNRNVISNPNTLPVGQTLKIHVGENWKPLFSYEEWFRLANRNGQWKPGRSWQPARVSSGTGTAPAAPPARKSESNTAAPVPEVSPKTAAPKESENPPTPQQTTPPKETPKEEAPPAPAEESREPEETDEEEEAPPAL